MGWDVYGNTVDGGVCIAQVPGLGGYSDGSKAFHKAMRDGHRKVKLLGQVPWNDPISGVVSDLDVEIPAGASVVLNTTDVAGLGQFGLENISVHGRGKIRVPVFTAGQSVLTIAALKAYVGGGLTIDMEQDGSGSPTAMKAVWLNGCTEQVIDELNIRPRRNVDSVVVNGGSRLKLHQLVISNGAAGALESYTPRKSGNPITITDCFAVDIGDVLLYAIGCTNAQLGENLPLDYGMKIIANTAAEYGHANIRSFRNFSFNCKIGIWLCGVPWFNIGSDCYFCTQGILCRDADDCAILLDSHNSTDGSAKKSGPGSIGAVHIHNPGLNAANGINVKRARDVIIRDPFISDLRCNSGIKINTPQCRNIAIPDLAAGIAFDATADCKAPIDLVAGAADGISIGKVTSFRQKSDAGVGPVAWNGTVPVNGLGSVTGNVKTRGLWDVTNAQLPTAGGTPTTMDDISESIPVT